MIKISEGLTYEYVIHGIFIIFAGILLSLANVFFIVLIGIGLLFILVSSGVLIDTKLNRIKKYHSIGPIELKDTGSWIDLKNIIEIKLKYNTNEGNTYRPIYLAKAPSTLTTYDLILTDELDNKVIVYDFKDMRQALKTMTQLEKISNSMMKNEVKENIQSKLQNRRKRRR
ncbi:MAG: hypothetical protein COA32_16660 [Fluviicola sp.]|nr:MAG: hypothetical protein COA32_16660 [Fluviicola sp.]